MKNQEEQAVSYCFWTSNTKKINHTEPQEVYEVRCSDIQYFGNAIYIFQKGTALLQLTHQSLRAMRLNIPHRPLPEKKACFKEKWQDVNKYIFTISSFKLVRYGTFEKNKWEKTKKKNCKDICIVTAPACQGNQLPQYCQLFLEFPKWKGRKKRQINNKHV